MIFSTQNLYYSGNTLGELQLSWYSEINPNKTVEIVNYLKRHALNGEKIFYDIYTDKEKKADPKKENIGLFFFSKARKICRLLYAMQAVHLLM